MNRTVERLFKNSFHVGNRYDRFRILVIGEGGSDFRFSQKENHAVFLEHMHGYFQRILDAFEAAAEELEINLDDTDRAEFFAVYSYYWWNIHREEINSIGAKFDRAIYFKRLIDELRPKLILSAGGNFKEISAILGNETSHEIFIHNREAFYGDREFPFVFDVIHLREELKDIFKAYFKTCHTEFDTTVEDIADKIAEGSSPLEASDEILGAGAGEFNTYPMGTPTNKLYPDLLTICEDPHTFEKILAHIYRWLNDTDWLFPQRQVVLFTDKWIPETLSRYQKAFRRFTRRGVTFDFRLTTDRGAFKIQVF